MAATIPPSQNQRKSLRGTCPFCLCEVDVYFDVKERPYFSCGRCQTRTFASRTTLDLLMDAGWIWESERPLDALQAWLRRVAREAGLTEGHSPSEEGNS